MKRFVKDGNAAKDYLQDWTAFLGADTITSSIWLSGDPLWAAGSYRLGDRVRLSGGAVLECVVAGASGATAPAPPAIGSTVIDGAVTWLRSFNIDSVTNSPTTATAWVSGGTTNVEYPIVNRITTTGGRTEDDTFIFVIIQK